MAKSFVLSDEYNWSASFGLFEVVAEFLLENVTDRATADRIREVVEHNLPGVDLRDLPPAGREQVLAAFRERLVPMIESTPKVRLSGADRRPVVGHVKVLKLMADDLARPGDG